MGGVFNHINGNLYHYAGNNPVKYTDPDGKIAFCAVTALIGAGIGAAYGAYKSYSETGSVDLKEVSKDALMGCVIGLGLGVVTAATVAGSATASYSAVMAGAKVAATATFGAGSTVAATSEKAWGNLQRAEEFGIKAYSQLKNTLTGAGLQAHHIIEKRFLNCPALQKLGLMANKMLSVAVTAEEHQQFTNAWRKEFAYGTDYAKITIAQIWESAQKVYADYPQLLEAARKTLFGE